MGKQRIISTDRITIVAIIAMTLPWIILSGRDVFHEHVKEYKLAFSNDGSNFQFLRENGKEKVSLKRQSVLMFHNQSILHTAVE